MVARDRTPVVLDKTDRLLVNALQDDLSLDHRPFATLADKLGLTEDEVLTRTKALREKGVLTRFGPFFDAACEWAGPSASAPWRCPPTVLKRS